MTVPRTLNKKIELEETLNQYFRTCTNKKKFSGSVLIAKDNEVLFSKGYGMADYKKNIPNTPKTKFLIGSVTKPFTALAILQLQEKGFLKVEDTLDEYLPDYPKGNEITLHHLLTHTSGIPNYVNFPEYPEYKKISATPKEIMESFKNKPLDFKPGKKCQYSNSGYILLGKIIEHFSGKPYRNFLNENIFLPAGMKSTGYNKENKPLEGLALGYVSDEGKTKNSEFIDLSLPFSAGGLHSTTEDLYLWYRALKEQKLLNSQSIKKMFFPHTDISPDDNKKVNYGYGWMIFDVLGHKCLGHSGEIDGFSGFLSQFPHDDCCVIVLSNFEHAPLSEINSGLAEILFT